MSGAATSVADGTIPLLDFEQLAPALRQRLGARVERLGYLGDFFRVGGHQSAALAAFVDFTEAGKEALPDHLVELIALTCAVITTNEYERCQHERLALRLGFGADWIAAVERLDPEGAELSPLQGLVQRYVLAALADHGHGAQTALAAIVAESDVETAVAVMLICGRYVAHALVVNSCGIVAPVDSIFVDGELSR